MGSMEVDCKCSVLRTAEDVVSHSVAVGSQASGVVGALRKDSEEEEAAAAALQIDSGKSLGDCRKDVIDMVVQAMRSAELGTAPTILGSVETWASCRRQKDRER